MVASDLAEVFQRFLVPPFISDVERVVIYLKPEIQVVCHPCFSLCVPIRYDIQHIGYIGVTVLEFLYVYNAQMHINFHMSIERGRNIFVCLMSLHI